MPYQNRWWGDETVCFFMFSKQNTCSAMYRMSSCYTWNMSKLITILEDMMPRFGTPFRARTDWGLHFANDRSQTKGGIEHYNYTILTMLRVHVTEIHSDWAKYVDMVLSVYDTSVQETIRHFRYIYNKVYSSQLLLSMSIVHLKRKHFQTLFLWTKNYVSLLIACHLLNKTLLINASVLILIHILKENASSSSTVVPFLSLLGKNSTSSLTTIRRLGLLFSDRKNI